MRKTPKNKENADFGVFLLIKMETAGVEPASENLFMQLSPGAGGLLCFPPDPPSAGLIESVAF